MWEYSPSTEDQKASVVDDITMVSSFHVLCLYGNSFKGKPIVGNQQRKESLWMWRVLKIWHRWSWTHWRASSTSHLKWVSIPLIDILQLKSIGWSNNWLYFLPFFFGITFKHNTLDTEMCKHSFNRPITTQINRIVKEELTFNHFSTCYFLSFN